MTYNYRLHHLVPVQKRLLTKSLFERAVCSRASWKAALRSPQWCLFGWMISFPFLSPAAEIEQRRDFTVTSVACTIPLPDSACCDYEWTLWSLLLSLASLWAVSAQSPPPPRAAGDWALKISSYNPELIFLHVCVCVLLHQLWHTQMFWKQSDRETIFRPGCPHVGGRTARGLYVCASVTWRSVNEEQTNIQQCPGGETEHMESRGKRGKAVEN